MSYRVLYFTWCASIWRRWCGLIRKWFTCRLSKLDFLPTGLGVVILWFTLCLAISLSAAGKPKEDSEPTPCGSPILVMTLILGLLAQLHPSASGTLGTVVDSIPEIASTGCVLSAGRISITHNLNISLLCFLNFIPTAHCLVLNRNSNVRFLFLWAWEDKHRTATR